LVLTRIIHDAWASTSRKLLSLEYCSNFVVSTRLEINESAKLVSASGELRPKANQTPVVVNNSGLVLPVYESAPRIGAKATVFRLVRFFGNDPGAHRCNPNSTQEFSSRISSADQFSKRCTGQTNTDGAEFPQFRVSEGRLRQSCADLWFPDVSK
jgi:hypothetical protein